MRSPPSSSLAEPSRFFSIAAGVKELSLSNAFSDIVTRVDSNTSAPEAETPGYGETTTLATSGGGV